MDNELQQFKSTYITECLELLANMEDSLMNLDEANADTEKLNAIFRCAHSIKGGAGAFGFSSIANFTHILEALLDQMREGKIAPSRHVIDTLLKSKDIVLTMVNAARDGSALPDGLGEDVAQELAKICNMPAPVKKSDKDTVKTAEDLTQYRIRFIPHPSMIAHGSDPLLLLRELKRMGECTITADTNRIPNLHALQCENSYLGWDITLASIKPKSLIAEVFEFVEDECELVMEEIAPQHETVQAAEQDAHQQTPSGGQPPKEQVQASTSIRVDIDKVDRLINMVGEIVIIQAMLSMQTRFLIAQEHTELVGGINELTTHTRELQAAVMAIRMQPVKSIFSRMPRLVRDLSSQLGKNIRLEMSGENTEVDKTIIEQLADPLTHMIRNSIDHGIEMPEQRVQEGKPAQGTIHLSAAHRGGRIVIEISDDGAGINRDKVLAKAKEKHLITADANLSPEDIDQLIFAPGFSTAETVTSISGRGVGMDVVKRNIEGIGGTVTVANIPGKGAHLTTSLPLTLAILDGMIVRVASEFYIIPIANIIETLRPKAEEVRDIADGQSVINVRGNFVPVLYLYRLFSIKNAIRDASKGLVVLVENGHEQIGLVVDELVGQQQVVIKTLEDNADPVIGVSGATILGDGKVSLILDIAGLRRMNHCLLTHDDNPPESTPDKELQAA